MKILAFAASNSKTSINKKLVQYAMTTIKDSIIPEAEFELIDLNDYEMPIYSPEREATGIPEQAQSFFQKIGEADAVLVSFAEYNGSVTAAWKNIFDWMSRINMKVWQSKPIVMLAATPGPRSGAGVLCNQKEMAPHFGADIRGIVGIGTWSKAWDADRQVLVRSEDLAALNTALSGLSALHSLKS